MQSCAFRCSIIDDLARYQCKLTARHACEERFIYASLQHVDTGEILMQAFADRAAISETMQVISAHPCPYV